MITKLLKKKKKRRIQKKMTLIHWLLVILTKWRKFRLLFWTSY